MAVRTEAPSGGFGDCVGDDSGVVPVADVDGGCLGECALSTRGSISQPARTISRQGIARRAERATRVGEKSEIARLCTFASEIAFVIRCPTASSYAARWLRLSTILAPATAQARAPSLFARQPGQHQRVVRQPSLSPPHGLPRAGMAVRSGARRPKAQAVLRGDWRLWRRADCKPIEEEPQAPRSSAHPRLA